MLTYFKVPLQSYKMSSDYGVEIWLWLKSKCSRGSEDRPLNEVSLL